MIGTAVPDWAADPPPAPQPAQRPLSGKPWQDMDYGPFLSASIEAPHPPTNIAFKGIAINLGAAFGGTQNEAVVFDTDLLRYSAAWTGDFVALKGVVFDGEHWAYPQIAGQQVFGNSLLPGWAGKGSFKDPRPFIYGPLPREWAHWRGLYLHRNQVLLAYSVGAADVYELPGLERHRSVTAFSRTIEIGKSHDDLTLQLASAPDRIVQSLALADLKPGDDRSAAETVMALATPPPAARLSRTAEASEEGLAARWDFDRTDGDRVTATRGRSVLSLHNHRWAEGRQGQALAFDGKGYGELPPPDAVDFDGNDLTLAAWIKTSGDGSILSTTAPAGPWVPDGKALFVRDGRLVFDVGWVGAVQSQRRVATDRWVHVAMTWSHRDGQVKLFVDGQPDGAGVLKPKRPVQGHVTRVGFTAPNFPATPYFTGCIDDLRIYRRRLSDVEMQALGETGANLNALAFGLAGAPAGATWVTTDDGQVRLQIPGAATPCRLRVMIAGVPEVALPQFAELVRRAPPPADLKSLTRGGPPRWAHPLITRGRLGADTGPYAIDALTWPDNNPWHSWMRFAGLDFFSDPTRAAICTWSGDVWVVSGIDEKLERLEWHRFAAGLYQPLGLKIVHDQVYVLGRDQITRLHDLNGDGEADFYENFNNDTQNTEHFHEFAMDLQTDTAGNFYYMKAGRHAREALHPQHGTLMKVSKDGSRSEIVANGFRAPNGLEVTSNGDCYTTDQEGYWMPANRLEMVKPGGFYGNNWSWLPQGKRTTDDPPICWVHPSVDRSPSTMALVTSEKWGPLHGKLLSLSYGMGRIFHVMTETVDGVMQGGVTPLPLDFGTGIMRARFHPRDGQLYLCGLYGWAGNKTQPGGFYRVRYTGKTLHLPAELQVATNGVLLTFTMALDPASATEVGNYSVQIWNYRWTQNYGSPDFKLNGDKGRDRLAVEAAALSSDRKTVFLKLPGICPVMQMHIQFNLKAADGTPMQSFIHSTIHTLGRRDGESSIGAQALVARVTAPQKLEREAPGLVQTFSVIGGGHETDTRRARLVALHVPAGTTPAVFLPPAPFACRWDGFLKLEVSDTFVFGAAGRGAATVRVDDNVALAVPDLAQPDGSGSSLALRGGLHKVSVEYRSPPAGAAVLRLYWSSPMVSREPVPPTVFVHEADDAALRDGDQRRLGRELFAARQCLQCHQTSSVFNSGAMPDLQMDAPALDNAGRQFHAGWVARWLENPRAELPEAWMPAVLHGSPEGIKGQARDLAAFLATLGQGIPADIDLGQEKNVKKGEERFATLGCVACHVLPGDARLEEDTRRSLGHVKAKWRPEALVEFLLQPSKHQRWSRMPDFRLSTDEASAIAGYVLARGAASPASGAAIVGNADNGKKLAASLGCANCHSIPGIEKSNAFPPLGLLAGNSWDSGCLDAEPARRRSAPDFGFDAAQRGALRGFLRRDVGSLGREVWPEFAERQFKNLRCAACHQREDAPDFWFAVESKTAAGKPVAANPFDDGAPAQETTIHRQRPPLVWTGEKLRPEWVEQFIGGAVPYKPRPKLEARMPGFPAYARGLATGFALEHGFSAASPPPEAVDAPLAAIGRQLIQKGALACVDCHSVGPQAALAGADTVTINFAWIPDRLNKHYFDRYLQDPQRVLPGTMMPKFSDDAGHTGMTATFDGDARRQFEAVWQFMRTLPPKEN